MADNYVEIYVDEVIAETPDAILVKPFIDEKFQAWIPKNCISHDSGVEHKGEDGVLVLKRSMAEKKELI